MTDDFLGPRRPVDSIERLQPAELLARAIRGASRWRCEAPLIAILDRFCTLIGSEPRSHQVRRQWMAGGRAWLEELGETPDLLEAAFHEMDKDNLTIATPRSLISVGMRLKRGKYYGRGDSEEERRRYLRGSLVEE